MKWKKRRRKNYTLQIDYRQAFMRNILHQAAFIFISSNCKFRYICCCYNFFRYDKGFLDFMKYLMKNNSSYFSSHSFCNPTIVKSEDSVCLLNISENLQKLLLIECLLRRIHQSSWNANANCSHFLFLFYRLFSVIWSIWSCFSFVDLVIQINVTKMYFRTCVGWIQYRLFVGKIAISI